MARPVEEVPDPEVAAPSDAPARVSGVQRKADADTAAPLLPPDTFDKLTKKKMMAELKRLDLARGRSRARKAELSALYRDWYSEALAEEPESAAEAPTEEVEPSEQASDHLEVVADAAEAVRVEPEPVEPEPVAEPVAEVAPVEAEPVEPELVAEPEPVQPEPVAEAKSEPAPQVVETEAAPAEDFELDIAPTADERRQSDRVRLEVDIGFRTETNFYVGFSTDISEGGIFVATVNLLPVGCPVSIAFVLPNNFRVDAQGTVAWVRDPIGFDFTMASGLGIAFRELEPEAVKAIGAYMALREPMFYVD